jgi:hypothetical protein
MSTEKTWVTNANFDLYVGSDRAVYCQTILMEIKNRLVASGGWTVVGSSDGVGYEYSGVTGGGPYGGDSTGAYDMWEATSDIPLAADGSGPGWCLLRGPVYQGEPVFMLLAREGTTYTAGQWLKVADVNWLPNPDDPTQWLPIEGTNATVVGFERHVGYYNAAGTFTRRAYLSMCPETGAFFLALNMSTKTFWTAFYSFMRVDPTSKPEGTPGFAVGMGGQNGFTSYYEYHWRGPTQTQFPGVNTDFLTWSDPMRATNVQVLVTDIAPLNCDGEADFFPFYLSTPSEISNVEYKRAVFGRGIDFFIAPPSLNDGDSVPSASTEYYVFGFWMIPGDTVPVLGP